jgi:hypothetical protein
MCDDRRKTFTLHFTPQLTRGLTGREIIVVSKDSISVGRQVLGWIRSKEFGLADVSDLRVAPVALNPMDPKAGLQSWGIGGGIIAFDYGAKS